MRVLQSIANLSRGSGGTSAYVAAVCSALAKKSSVEIALLAQGAKENRIPVDSGVQMPDLKVSGSRGYYHATSVMHRSTPFDLIHQHGLWVLSGHQIQKAAQDLAIPSILSTHGMLEPQALQFSYWKKRLALIAYQQRDLARVDAFHATALAEAECIRKFGLSQPIIISSPGVILPDLTSLARGRPDQKFNSQPTVFGPDLSEKRTVLFLGRVHHIKNLLSLVEAWASVCPAGWRLILAGADEGGYSDEIRKAIRNHGLSEVVELRGAAYGVEKDKLYRQASLFVLPSFSENFGIVVPEALSYGVPVIASTGAPWAELLERNCGWWVKPDPVSLSEALEDATQLPCARLSEMGMNGRALVEEKYQWDSIAEEMLAGYRWMIGNGPRPSNVLLG